MGQSEREVSGREGRHAERFPRRGSVAMGAGVCTAREKSLFR